MAFKREDRGEKMLKDLAKEFHMTPIGAKSVAFDCINEISDLYGSDPVVANAMIKGVRYYLGYLVQAGAFEEIVKSENP